MFLTEPSDLNSGDRVFHLLKEAPDTSKKQSWIQVRPDR